MTQRTQATHYHIRTKELGHFRPSVYNSVPNLPGTASLLILRVPLPRTIPIPGSI